MLKNTAVIAVSTLLASVTLATQPNKKSSNKEGDAPTKNPPIVLPAPNHQENTDTEKPHPHPDAPKAHASFPDPNWVLVAVGAITAIVIAWQSYETRKTAHAAKMAAEAAQVSADIAVNAARAWVITSQVRFNPDMPDLADKGASVKSKMWVELHNAGGSPAEIIRARVVAIRLHREFALSEEPLYDPSENMYAVAAMAGEILAAGDKKSMLCRLQNAELLTPQERTSIQNGTERLICYGKIEYRDVAGESRTTQFGYEFYVRLKPTDDRPEAMYRLPLRAYNLTD